MTPAWGSHLRMHSPHAIPLILAVPLQRALQAQPPQLKIMCADEHAPAGGIVQANKTFGPPAFADESRAGTQRHP